MAGTRICPQCKQRMEATRCPKCRITTVDERSLKGEGLIGQVFADKYQVEALLGRGGMGAVYRARHLAMDSVVAIKVMRREAAEDLEAIERFYREARAASRLKHVNTIRVFDFGQSEEGLLYLVMEYLEGTSLREEMRRVGRMEEGRVLRIAEQVCKALGEAHAMDPPIVHRDIKPENVFLVAMRGEVDFVKVLDFGIAKTGGDPSLTQGAIGTPKYMSPEQGGGKRVDGRSDLYSLGVMLYEMVCGHAPFESDTPLRLLLMHMQEPIPPLTGACPGVSREFAGLVHALLEKDPGRRPASADEVLARIAFLRRLEAREALPGPPPADAEATQPVPSLQPSPAPRADGPATVPEEIGPRRNPEVNIVAPRAPGAVAKPPQPAQTTLRDEATAPPQERSVVDRDRRSANSPAAHAPAPVARPAPQPAPEARPARNAPRTPDEEEVPEWRPKRRTGISVAVVLAGIAVAGIGALILMRTPGTDQKTASPETPSNTAGIDWVRVEGGTFLMGSDRGAPDEKPRHRVTVRTFEMARTEVTVEQYRRCVEAGACTEPGTGGKCNWGQAGRDRHPVNCVDWDQAQAFARWAGGRLPSEAEWEYAARSGGQEREYPWGNETATCERAVMDDGSGSGCGRGGTWPVCSRPGGNTEQGLCDMAGNVWEWVQDWYHGTYAGAPGDGRAWEEPSGTLRVSRGGSWFSVSLWLRASGRGRGGPGGRGDGLGFRLSRSVP